MHNTGTTEASIIMIQSKNDDDDNGKELSPSSSSLAEPSRNNVAAIQRIITTTITTTSSRNNVTTIRRLSCGPSSIIAMCIRIGDVMYRCIAGEYPYTSSNEQRGMILNRKRKRRRTILLLRIDFIEAVAFAIHGGLFADPISYYV